MPSGAKKRKTAKKKNENHSNNNNPTPSSASTQTHGDYDDVKHQDDKDSDVGEVNSPASQDLHSRHNFFSGGEDEIEGNSMSNLPPLGERSGVIDEPHKMVMEESFVPTGNNSDKKDGKNEHDEIASKCYDEGSSESSSSNRSSDDESREIKIFKDENVPAFVPVDICLSGDKAEVGIISSQADDSVVPSMEESELIKENEEKKLSYVEDKSGISEDEAIASSVANIAAIYDRTECIVQETDDPLSVSYNVPIASGDNEGDRGKNSGVSEPLLAPASHLEQTASWKSCCGLFEVFSGSGR